MLIENSDDIEVIKQVPISPMFKGKILSIYYPGKFMNVFFSKALELFHR